MKAIGDSCHRRHLIRLLNTDRMFEALYLSFGSSRCSRAEPNSPLLLSSLASSRRISLLLFLISWWLRTPGRAYDNAPPHEVALPRYLPILVLNDAMMRCVPDEGPWVRGLSMSRMHTCIFTVFLTDGYWILRIWPIQEKKVYLLIIPDFVRDILTTTFSSQTKP